MLNLYVFVHRLRRKGTGGELHNELETDTLSCPSFLLASSLFVKTRPLPPSPMLSTCSACKPVSPPLPSLSQVSFPTLVSLPRTGRADNPRLCPLPPRLAHLYSHDLVHNVLHVRIRYVPFFLPVRSFWGAQSGAILRRPLPSEPDRSLAT